MLHRTQKLSRVIKHEKMEIVNKTDTSSEYSAATNQCLLLSCLSSFAILVSVDQLIYILPHLLFYLKRNLLLHEKIFFLDAKNDSFSRNEACNLQKLHNSKKAYPASMCN